MLTFFITVKEFTHFVQFYQKRAKLLIIMYFCCLIVGENVSIYAFSVCKILSPENWVRVKFFWQIPSLSKISASSLFQIKKSKASVTNQHNKTWQTSGTTKYNNQVQQYVTNVYNKTDTCVQQYLTNVCTTKRDK